MKKIVFITPPDARYGFTSAGAHQIVTAPADAIGILRGVLSDRETGVVAVDERLVANIGEERLHRLARQWSGMLVVLPAPAAPGEMAEDYAIRLIRRAIGYHVRIEP